MTTLTTHFPCPLLLSTILVLPLIILFLLQYALAQCEREPPDPPHFLPPMEERISQEYEMSSPGPDFDEVYVEGISTKPLTYYLEKQLLKAQQQAIEGTRVQQQGDLEKNIETEAKAYDDMQPDIVPNPLLPKDVVPDGTAETTAVVEQNPQELSTESHCVTPAIQNTQNLSPEQLEQRKLKEWGQHYHPSQPVVWKVTTTQHIDGLNDDDEEENKNEDIATKKRKRNDTEPSIPYRNIEQVDVEDLPQDMKAAHMMWKEDDHDVQGQSEEYYEDEDWKNIDFSDGKQSKSTLSGLDCEIGVVPQWTDVKLLAAGTTTSSSNINSDMTVQDLHYVSLQLVVYVLRRTRVYLNSENGEKGEIESSVGNEEGVVISDKMKPIDPSQAAKDIVESCNMRHPGKKNKNTVSENMTSSLVMHLVFNSTLPPSVVATSSEARRQLPRDVPRASRLLLTIQKELLGSYVGQRLVLYIPPKKGFGLKGFPHLTIPPHASLVIDVFVAGVSLVPPQDTSSKDDMMKSGIVRGTEKKPAFRDNDEDDDYDGETTSLLTDPFSVDIESYDSPRVATAMLNTNMYDLSRGATSFFESFDDDALQKMLFYPSSPFFGNIEGARARDISIVDKPREAFLVLLNSRRPTLPPSLAKIGDILSSSGGFSQASVSTAEFILRDKQRLTIARFNMAADKYYNGNDSLDIAFERKVRDRDKQVFIDPIEEHQKRLKYNSSGEAARVEREKWLKKCARTVHVIALNNEAQPKGLHVMSFPGRHLPRENVEWIYKVQRHVDKQHHTESVDNLNNKLLELPSLLLILKERRIIRSNTDTSLQSDDPPQFPLRSDHHYIVQVYKLKKFPSSTRRCLRLIKAMDKWVRKRYTDHDRDTTSSCRSNNLNSDDNLNNKQFPKSSKDIYNCDANKHQYTRTLTINDVLKKTVTSAFEKKNSESSKFSRTFSSTTLLSELQQYSASLQHTINFNPAACYIDEFVGVSSASSNVMDESSTQEPQQQDQQHQRSSIDVAKYHLPESDILRKIPEEWRRHIPLPPLINKDEIETNLATATDPVEQQRLLFKLYSTRREITQFYNLINECVNLLSQWKVDPTVFFFEKVRDGLKKGVYFAGISPPSTTVSTTTSYYGCPDVFGHILHDLNEERIRGDNDGDTIVKIKNAIETLDLLVDSQEEHSSDIMNPMTEGARIRVILKAILSSMEI